MECSRPACNLYSSFLFASYKPLANDDFRGQFPSFCYFGSFAQSTVTF